MIWQMLDYPDDTFNNVVETRYDDNTLVFGVKGWWDDQWILFVALLAEEKKQSGDENKQSNVVKTAWKLPCWDFSMRAADIFVKSGHQISRRDAKTGGLLTVYEVHNHLVRPENANQVVACMLSNSKCLIVVNRMSRHCHQQSSRS